MRRTMSPAIAGSLVGLASSVMLGGACGSEQREPRASPSPRAALAVMATTPPADGDIAGPANGRGPQRPLGGTGSAVAQEVCDRKHRGWKSRPGDEPCPTGGCGMNGVWLGSGVAFRTLHLDRMRLNPQGLRIKEFTAQGDDLQVEVTGQLLSGVHGTKRVEGESLIGAALTLEHVDVRAKSADGSYVLKITGVRDEEFWANCVPGSKACGAVPAKARLYAFEAWSSDGCKVELCRPGLTDDYQGGLSGTAVIFRGDYYNDDYTIRTSPPQPGDDDVFNIACVGTDIAKLHLLRHTSAADPAEGQPTANQRQALLRLFAADYCGIGHPFTKDGTRIKLGLRSTRWQPSPASGFALPTSPVDGPQRSRQAPGTLNAWWTDAGASCIDVPRIAEYTLGDINLTCGHAVPACQGSLRNVVRQGYAWSWNP